MTDTSLDLEIAGLAATIGGFAKAGDTTIAVAESCTAGRIAAALAGAEEAERFFAGGVVAYQEVWKHRLLGVATHDIYSERCASEMAAGVCRLFEADHGLAITGVTGVASVDDTPPGTVFVAVAVDGDPTAATAHVTGSPLEMNAEATLLALRFLRRRIGGRSVTPG